MKTACSNIEIDRDRDTTLFLRVKMTVSRSIRVMLGSR